MTPGPILICSDGSELATHGALSALPLLDRGVGRMLVTVIDAPDAGLVIGDSGLAGPTLSPAEFDKALQEALRAGQEIVDDLARELGDPGIEKRVLDGPPGPTLCAVADEVAASILVLGSRGRGGIKRAVLGSVSDHVVRNAPCPVLVVRGPRAGRRDR